MSTSFNPPATGSFQNRAWLAGGVLLLGLLVVLFVNPTQFFRAYLVGWTFWTGIAVGSLALLMLQHLTGGGWGLVIRRVLEAATRTLPFMAVLFIPIILGSHSLYEWTHREELAQLPAVQFKTPFLNLPFFIVRTIVYFGVWITLAFFLNRWSLMQDRTGEARYAKNMRVLSGPGMVALIFVVTFASIDWYMSLEPEWFSTIYGFIFVASWSLSALAFVIAAMATLSKEEPLAHIVKPLHFQDLGKLLLALVMLWAYFAFSQYLIIWSGNLPQGVAWFAKRGSGGWSVVEYVITISALGPLFLLFFPPVRAGRFWLIALSLVVMLGKVFELAWLVLPTMANPGIGMASMVLAVVGLVALVLVALQRLPVRRATAS